jgi:plastocyanin
MNRYSVIGAVATLLLAGCAGSEPAESDSAAGAPAASSAAAGGAVTPLPGGKVVEVKMITDEKGNYFEPADFEVKKGDVIRFTLAQGVHNANFVADSNPGVQGLPPASPLLQLPGQTTDVLVDWDPGKHFYQCDPHALLGMVGHVTVAP